MLLQGNSWRLRFDGLSLRFWQKTNSFATLTHVFFSQTSTRVHQILIPTHNHEVTPYLPLDVDSINENDSVANPDPTPRIASVHKSRFGEVVIVGCWIEAVYYGLLLFTMT